MNYAFVNLEWNWCQARPEEKAEEYYNADFSDDETDVFRCHINEIDHISLLDPYQDTVTGPAATRPTNIPSDPRNGKIYPRFLVDHSKCAEPKLFGSFPMKSTLPAWAHNSCIRAITRIRNRLTDVCRSGNGTPMSTAECKDLETYTASWEKRQNELINFQEFVKKQFLANVVSLMENVNPIGSDQIIETWEQNLKIPRAGHYSIQTCLPLDFEANGNLTLQVGPAVLQGGTLVEYNTKVSNKWCRPSSLQSDAIKALDFHFKSMHYKAIAVKHKANMVLSLNVLKKLLNYPNNCNESWNIPFEVQNIEELSYERICFFDEVLPQSFLSKAERNKKAIQLQVQSCTINQRDCKTFCLGSRMYSKLISENETAANSQDFEYKVMPSGKYVQKENCLRIEPPHILRLATLDVNDQKTVKLLIGQSIQSFETSNSGEPTLVNVSSKLEYQTQFGAEQMSGSELIDEWCAQTFQPDSVTDRFRVDSVSGEVMSVARLTLPEIESEMLRLHKLRPNAMLGRLSNIFAIIERLPANKYLLRHTAKGGNKVMVFVQSDNKTPTSVDISQMLAADFEAQPPETIPWNPIDDMEITRVHRNANVMPCAFPHNSRYLRFANNKHHHQTMKIVANDRGKIVMRAEQKKQLELQKSLANDALRKSKLKKAKKAKKAKNAKKKAASPKRGSTIGETIDPYLVFDAHGNILVEELMSTAQSQATSSNSDSRQFNAATNSDDDTSIDYLDYAKQANL